MRITEDHLANRPLWAGFRLIDGTEVGPRVKAWVVNNGQGEFHCITPHVMGDRADELVLWDAPEGGDALYSFGPEGGFFFCDYASITFEH